METGRHFPSESVVLAREGDGEISKLAHAPHKGDEERARWTFAGQCDVCPAQRSTEAMMVRESADAPAPGTSMQEGDISPGGGKLQSARSRSSELVRENTVSSSRKAALELTVERFMQDRYKQTGMSKSFGSLMADSGQFQESEHDEGALDHMRSSMRSSRSGNSAHDRSSRGLARWVVRHQAFDIVVGAVVILNSVCIAIEQQYKLANHEAPLMKVLEEVFLAFYFVELTLRLYGGGLAQLRDKATLFDFVLVSVAVVDQWIMNVSQTEGMQPMVVARIARLARLARSVRLIMLFHDLWKLVQGLIASAGIMFYTLFLLSIIVFAFALVGVELIAVPHLQESSPDPVIDGIVEEYFSSLGLTMLTLVQFVTLDGVGQIYRPLIKNDPALAIYFIAVILVIGIVLMNLITAVLVNRALEDAEQNKEATKMYENRKKKNMLRELRDFFVAVDEDGSGTVNLQEMLGASDEVLDFIHGCVSDKHLKEVFEYLDIDNDGELEIEEFCEGLHKAMTSQTPVEVRRIDKRVEGLRAHVTDLVATQTDILQKLAEVGNKVLEDLKFHHSANAHKPLGVAGEPPLHVVDMETPAWGRQMLFELSQLKADLGKQLAAESELPFSDGFSQLRSDLGKQPASESELLISDLIMGETYGTYAVEASPPFLRCPDMPLLLSTSSAHAVPDANAPCHASMPKQA